MNYKKIVLKEKTETADVVEVDESRLVNREYIMSKDGIVRLVSERIGGDFEGKAYYLSSDYDWVVGRDNDGFVCLIPLRK